MVKAAYMSSKHSTYIKGKKDCMPTLLKHCVSIQGLFKKLNAPDANTTTTTKNPGYKTKQGRENESNKVVRRLLFTKLQWQPTLCTAYVNLKAHMPASPSAKHEIMQAFRTDTHTVYQFTGHISILVLYEQYYWQSAPL